MRAELFVIYADGPPKPADLFGKPLLEFAYHDAEGRLRHARASQRMKVEQWIVPGMRVPGVVDPSDPGKAEVLLDEIPPLTQRILANDPALSGQPSVWQEIRAMRRALVHERVAQERPDLGLPPEWEAQLREFERRDLEEDAAELTASRPSGPVVDDRGRLRGTADLVSLQLRPRAPAGQGGGQTKLKRIYRVWLYGYDPYPVLDEAWVGDPSSRGNLAYGQVPVAVSQTDRTDVEFLWKEYDRDPGEVMHGRVMKGMDRAMRDADYLAGQWMVQAFEAVEPEHRHVLAEQMRAQGHEVPDHLFRDRERMSKLQALLERGVVTPEEYDHYLTKL